MAGRVLPQVRNVKPVVQPEKDALSELKGRRLQRFFRLGAHTSGVASVGITPAAMKSSLFSTLIWYV